MRRRPPLTPAEWSTITFPVADMWVSGLNACEIVEAIRKKYDIELSRQQVHRAISRARDQGMLWLSPPRTALEARALSAYPNQGDVRVVHSIGTSAFHLATAGAEVTYRIVQTLALQQSRPRPVHVAFGVGRLTYDLVRAFASCHLQDENAPDLVLHAMATSFAGLGYEQNPIGHPAHFSHPDARVTFEPLDGEPLVSSRDLPEVMKRQWVQQAFREREKVDVVVTSLARADDGHSCMNGVLAMHGMRNHAEKLRKRGWVGDVQLRPYAADGPLKTNTGSWPLTLYELPDLVRLARTAGKHVVLLAGPCAQCGRSKADALRPLLEEPSLHVWNHLVVDERTARELAIETAPPPPPKRRRKDGDGREAQDGDAL